jgi:S-adenosylmethionine:tRNA ribosyltransferase-isomerase
MNELRQYDYHLPEELIAGAPLAQRDKARLLVADRSNAKLQHRHVCELPDLLAEHDCLVLNDTQVIPARLLGRRADTGGKWEGLYLGTTAAKTWRLIGQTRGRLEVGERIVILPAHAPESGDELSLTLLERQPGNVWIARSDSELGALELLRHYGTVPLPPYVRRKLATPNDWDRYQTTYARRPGAVAAPTAGLHFTPDLFEQCQLRGIGSAFVTLHVGLGTFRPIEAKNLSDHRMHAEWCEVPRETAERIRATKRQGGRVVAVGTTTVRTLETAARSPENDSWQGETDLFIRPPYEFQIVDALLTNFHLPKSSLMVMVSAFAGIDLIQRAYACAIREQYRFYSYGDAMLIL